MKKVTDDDILDIQSKHADKLLPHHSIEVVYILCSEFRKGLIKMRDILTSKKNDDEEYESLRL